MNTVTKTILKREIDQLDDGYLELAYNILRQFPRRPLAPRRVPILGTSEAGAERDPLRHSRAICYAVNEDLRDVRPFADVADAGVFVSELRRRQWRGMGHG
jgi:hypothetical protein